jgi:hypothetical protein
MQITAAQVAIMRKHSEEAFVRRVVRFIAEQQNLPASEPSLRARCEDLVQRARSFGFETEFEVATFVMSGFTFGMDFDRQEGLPPHQILIDLEIEPQIKAERLSVVLDEFDRR